jgi:hypothetical protein
MIHNWTDGHGAVRQSEICGEFDRGEFHWVTVWDDRAEEFVTLEAGPKVLRGMEALETFTEDEQSTLWELACEMAADMSDRDLARAVIAEMGVSEFREWLESDWL